MARRGDNIHKRKDGRWEGRYKNGYRSDGSVRYSSVYAATYSDCKRKLKLAQGLKAHNADPRLKARAFSLFKP